MHVFEPFELYPLAPERAYNVCEAPLPAHERMKQQVGLERTVFVQASGHGTDNRAMLAALAVTGGLVAMVAMLFLVLLSTLAVAMYELSTLNTQSSYNLSDLQRARATAESATL